VKDRISPDEFRRFLEIIDNDAVCLTFYVPAVVKDQLLTIIIALPAKSFTPVVTVAMYVVPGLRLDDGAK
jgi:hypothetical protein